MNETNNNNETENTMTSENTTKTALTSEERFLLNHISMFGISGAPISKQNGRWVMHLPGNVVGSYKTKSQAYAQFDIYFAMLLEVNAIEADAERLAVQLPVYKR